MDRIVGSAKKPLGFIQRNIKTKNTCVREMAYNTLVRLQLKYTATEWDPHMKHKIQQVEEVQ